jgi:Helix-turn-helix.
MPRRGYPLEGHRAGGISMLAAKAGIPQATMSRLVHGQGEASVDNLRKLAKVFGKSLREMMIIAGLADSEEMAEPSTTLEEAADARLRLAVTVDPGVTMEEAIASLGDLTSNERILVANLQAMDFEPAAVAGAVLVVRRFSARGTSQQDGLARRRA